MNTRSSEKDFGNDGLGAEDTIEGDPEVGQTKLAPVEFSEQKDLRCVSLVICIVGDYLKRSKARTRAASHSDDRVGWYHWNGM